MVGFCTTGCPQREGRLAVARRGIKGGTMGKKKSGRRRRKERKLSFGGGGGNVRQADLKERGAKIQADFSPKSI